MVTWAGSFEWRGLTGSVQVECIPNDDPVGYGTAASDAFGLPVCTATVRYPRRGYNAMFGWVQLVRSTDNESGGQHFEMDPFALFGDVRSPYCWYGTEPTLFDTPSRQVRAPIEWIAYSFLATTPVDEVMQGSPRRVVPLLGFEWGFDIRPELPRRPRCVLCLRSDQASGQPSCHYFGRSTPVRYGPSPTRCSPARHTDLPISRSGFGIEDRTAAAAERGQSVRFSSHLPSVQGRR